MRVLDVSGFRRSFETQKSKIGSVALVAGIVQPLITVPQILTIYGSKSAVDVSLLTWLGYVFFGLIFLIYGVAFRLKPIWIGQIIWVTMQLIIVAGILLYQ